MRLEINIGIRTEDMVNVRMGGIAIMDGFNVETSCQVIIERSPTRSMVLWIGFRYSNVEIKFQPAR
jgi:hypothetical protein